MSDVSVREGRPDDGPALRRLAAETIGEPAAVRGSLQPDPGGDVVFVAEVSGHPAGYAAVHVDGAMLVVDRVMVAPADPELLSSWSGVVTVMALVPVTSTESCSSIVRSPTVARTLMG